jgi:hypothetical protein
MLHAELRSGPVVRGLDPEAEARAEAGAAYRAVLDPLEERHGVAAIDRIWAFPPREVGGVGVALIVASVYGDAEDRRRLVTSRVVVTPEPEGSRRREPTTDIEVEHQGEVPVDRVRRVLDGVVRRLGGDPGGESPAAFAIGGQREAWERMREQLHAELLADEAGPPDAPTPASAGRPSEHAPEHAPGEAVP